MARKAHINLIACLSELSVKQFQIDRIWLEFVVKIVHSKCDIELSYLAHLGEKQVLADICVMLRRHVILGFVGDYFFYFFLLQLQWGVFGYYK